MLQAEMLARLEAKSSSHRSAGDQAGELHANQTIGPVAARAMTGQWAAARADL